MCLLTGCKKGGPPPGMGNDPNRAIPVKLHTVSNTLVEDSDEYIATLESRKSINLYSRASTYIKQVYITSGQQVSQGQLLFSLDAGDEQAQVINQEANYNKAQSQYKLAQGQYARYKKLYTRELISKEELDTQYNNYITAQSAVNTSQAQLQSAKAKLNYTKITAPFSGIIGDVLAKQGNYITPLALLTTLSDISQLEVKLNIPSAKISQVQKGDNIYLLDEQGDITGEARVNFISPMVDAGTQTVLIKAIYNNNSRQLRTGQSIKTKVIYNKKQAIAVPNNTIKRQGDKKYIYIVEANAEGDSIAKQQEIIVSSIKNNKYIIDSGIEEGDTIVWEGNGKIFTPEAKVIDIAELKAQYKQKDNTK